MKINIKPMDVVKGANKIHFDGFEIEMSVEEIAVYYENLDKMEVAMTRFLDRMDKSVEKAKDAEAAHHKSRMEYLEAEEARDAKYHQNQVELENLRHQHWLEKYGKEEED